MRSHWVPSGHLRHAYAGVAESLADVVAPLAVAIADQHAMRDEKALVRRGQRSDDLLHEHLVGPRGRAREDDRGRPDR